MTQEIYNLCNKINKDLQIERFNERLCYIGRIFEYDKVIGADIKFLNKNPLYYNDVFDGLYEMPLERLERIDKEMSEAVNHYKQQLSNPNYYGDE